MSSTRGTEMTAPSNPKTQEGKPVITFADVVRAVEAAPDLTRGVRANMRTAVARCAGLVGHHGLHAVVDVQLIARKLEKVTPAKFGFTNPGSLAAFQSNLRRALRLAGITVMPGRHQEPLRPPWSDLADRARAQDDGFLWPAISRFMHYLSSQCVDPNDVNEHVFARFAEDLRRTCLGSKVDQVVRNTARAWKKAQQVIPAWPEATLGYRPRKSTIPLLPWSDFPATLEQDAQAFLTRDDNWLSLDDLQADDQTRPLRPATRSNYLDGLRRIASTLVALRTPRTDLCFLADLVQVERVRAVLQNVSARTGRTKGGHVMFLALLLFIVARDHVGITGAPLKKLETFFKKTRPETVGMSDRTLNRYTQFEDHTILDRLIRLPRQLMAQADKSNVPDISSAKRARLAVYLALLSETCARSGNIVSLNLQTHVVVGGDKPKDMFLVIPAHEVKNGQEIRVRLSKMATGMLRHYIDRYRPLHCTQHSQWLFPRQDGSHWTTTQACMDLKDIVARELGVDVTPHLMRSLGGKIILDAHPGAIATVQQLLGHKRLDTTLRFYARLDPQKARAEYQRLLEIRGN
jgi:integrase